VTAGITTGDPYDTYETGMPADSTPRFNFYLARAPGSALSQPGRPSGSEQQRLSVSPALRWMSDPQRSPAPGWRCDPLGSRI
jgi:hypothetical protein